MAVEEEEEDEAIGKEKGLGFSLLDAREEEKQKKAKTSRALCVRNKSRGREEPWHERGNWAKTQTTREARGAGSLAGSNALGHLTGRVN